jgi:hypothetical protein
MKWHGENRRLQFCLPRFSAFPFNPSEHSLRLPPYYGLTEDAYCSLALCLR